jgi:signal transduction histidine kinase
MNAAAGATDLVGLLRRILLVDAWVCAVSVAMLLVVWATVVDSAWVLVLAGFVAFACASIAFGLRPVAAGRLTAGVNHMAVANWGITVSVATIAPFAMPVMVIAALLPPVLVVPFVDHRLLRRYVAVSIVVATAAVTLATLQNVTGLDGEMPDWLEAGVLLAFTPVMAALVAVIAFQNLSVLATALDESVAARARLVDAQTRLVTAFDAARRSIERDLHDGAQQRLTAVAIRLGRTHARAAREGAEVAGELQELRDDLAAARAELRRLAHGLYPSSLALEGLAAALRTAGDRLDRPVRIRDDVAGPLPEAVQAAAYFCCLEAMHNVVNHAGRNVGIDIALTTGPTGELVFTVADGGAGFDPASAHEGHGLQNMRDRLGAFGGSLVVRSSADGGTVVTGTVPI